MLNRVAAALADRIGNDINGLRILTDWLGDGAIPCSKEEAESRSAICDKCPHNLISNSFESSIAAEILKQEQIRKQVDLTTANEARLNTCELCGCYLKLKVWVPMKYIGNSKKKLPHHCWQVTVNKQ